MKRGILSNLIIAYLLEEQNTLCTPPAGGKSQSSGNPSSANSASVSSFSFSITPSDSSRRAVSSTKAGRGGKSPPHKQDGSSGPPAPYQYPAHRSMRRSDRPRVVSSAICKPPFHGMKKSRLVNWLGGSDLPSWFYI